VRLSTGFSALPYRLLAWLAPAVARALVPAVVLGGCGVSQELYNARTTELDRCQTDLTRSQSDFNAARQKNEGLVDDATELRDRLTTLESDRFKLSTNLQSTKKEMDQLRRTQALADRRQELLRSVKERLASLIDDKTITVESRKARLLIRVAEKPLFEAGKAELKASGLPLIKQVAAVLRDLPDRDFLIAGHTDNQGLKGSTFRSNWELSAARAVAVVRTLQGEGVDPRHLGAAGYSEFDVLSDNTDEVGRTLNRRIEVVLMPTAEELAPLDSSEPAPASRVTAPKDPPAPPKP
jgi:chemotaxis protein MotB